jgi:aspartate/methionine/tyrosine aminotransferase
MLRPVNAVYGSLGTTIFETMSGLAKKHEAVNLGQGFPDDRGASDVLAKASEALLSGNNQYPSMLGLPELRQAVAAHEKRFYDLEIDPQTEVLVTSGATEALAACIFALVVPGDEVVLFEPAYDAYAPLVRRAGGVPRFVSLAAPDWTITTEALERVFSAKTKAVVFNNPHNPAGKVYTRAELDVLASFVAKYDAYAICDEVYEHIVFDGQKHVPLLTLPGMRERTVKIGSAGKTFSLTGWKVGMVVGPPSLIGPIGRAHQFLTFTTPPNLQAAVAFGLGKDDAFFHGLATELQRRRDRLGNGLRALGLDVLPAVGAYFVNIDIGSTGFRGTDLEFCRHLVEEVGVAAIPLSAFYEAAPVTNLVRFCFAKQDAVLDEALARLRKRFG